MIDYVLPAVQ